MASNASGLFAATPPLFLDPDPTYALILVVVLTVALILVPSFFYVLMVSIPTEAEKILKNLPTNTKKDEQRGKKRSKAFLAMLNATEQAKKRATGGSAAAAGVDAEMERETPLSDDEQQQAALTRTVKAKPSAVRLLDADANLEMYEEEDDSNEHDSSMRTIPLGPATTPAAAGTDAGAIEGRKLSGHVASTSSHASTTPLRRPSSSVSSNPTRISTTTRPSSSSVPPPSSNMPTRPIMQDTTPPALLNFVNIRYSVSARRKRGEPYKGPMGEILTAKGGERFGLEILHGVSGYAKVNFCRFFFLSMA
jgi:hypothetical protein